MPYRHADDDGNAKHIAAARRETGLSHADLGDGSVGIIDFIESGYIDEASDFMDVTEHEFCSIMLDTYGADVTLRKKVEMQRRIRPIFVLDVYADRDENTVQKIIQQIQYNTLESM